MTVVLLVIIFLLLVATPKVYLVGWNTGLKEGETKEIEYKHMHIWGPWKADTIAYTDGDTGKHLYDHAAQSRTCDECGFMELRKLVAL